MASWEYGYLWVQSWHRGQVVLGDGEPQALGLSNRQEVLAQLNRLGADGWELAANEVTVNSADDTHTVFWLKRERS